MTGRRVVGLVAIVIAVLGGVWDVLVFWPKHPARGGPAGLVFFGIILVVGVLLLVLGPRSSKAQTAE
jgi:hypothetical protein